MSQHPSLESALGQRGAASDRPIADVVRKTSLTRRSALKALLGVAAAAVLVGNPLPALAAPSASKETLDKLGNAQAQLDDLQKKLDALTAEYQEIARKQDITLSQIEEVQTKIEATEQQIETKKKELKEKQSVLAKRVSTTYKTRGNDALALLVSSSSFEDLIQNAHYVDSLNEHDHDAISEVQRVQKELDAKKGQLDDEKGKLEKLRDQGAEQLKASQAKQESVQSLLSSASNEVKDLIAQRDAEIVAAAAAAAEKARQDAASRWHPRPPAPSGGSGQGTDGLSGAQSRVVDCCFSTGCPGANLCAAWVSYVFQNAGFGHVSGNANNMYWDWCSSSNKNDLKVGMLVAVSTYSKNQAGRTYGHVGVYIGNNQLRENIGYINTHDLDSWIAYYGDTVTPRWGWANGVDLSTRG